MKKNHLWKKALVFLALAVCSGALMNSDRNRAEETVQAKELPLSQEEKTAEEETVIPPSGELTLRLIFTTDIHGQVSSRNYEQGTDYSVGGLARAYDLILQARREAGEDYSYTFDVGDTLYDVTTEYIMGQAPEALQPVYEAMSYVGYDAVTLGNHDFDYGKDYILEQLEMSGLMDKVVVSNLTDSKSGEYPFLQHMLLTRELTTSTGATTTVTVGVIGETIPKLSSKTESYTGVWKTEDIVENVKKEAALLKQQGADLVVVLAHSGFGAEEPEENDKNVSYALTKIPEVDVVLCGHEHNEFPSADTNNYYYRLPGVDKKTGLVNGKTIVMANDRGKSIGIADLTFLLEEDGSLTLVRQEAQVRKVSEYETTETEEIKNLLKDWEEELAAYADEVIAVMKEGETLQSFFGTVEDNAALQLANDAKISFALRYIHTKNEAYKGYPVIAASSYKSFGQYGADEYVNISGNITEASLGTIQPYNKYIGIYEITGKQLREWLEWTASAYVQTSFSSLETLDEGMAAAMEKTGLLPLIKEEWEDKLDNFYIFDGVSYVIDPSYPARYTADGVKETNASRIVSLTYNGKEVQDTDVFVLACDLISQPKEVTAWAESQKLYSAYNRVQEKMAEYITLLGKSGGIAAKADGNWKIKLNADYRYLLWTSALAKEFVLESGWYEGLAEETEEKSYYVGRSVYQVADREAPSIVVSPLVTTYSRRSYEVAVQVTDASELASVKYYAGDVDADYYGWNLAAEVKNGVFKVYYNGIYTIRAEDIYGNCSLYQLTVDNIVDDKLAAPQVDNYTNRKSAVSGTADAGTIIVIETPEGTYETQTRANGVFECTIPAQQSGTVIYIYAREDRLGLVSEKVRLMVKRTGPNQPEVEPVFNNTTVLHGNTNDADAMIVVVADSVVYVPAEGGRELFLAADEFNHEKNEYLIVETDYAAEEDGRFSMLLPAQAIGQSLKVYSIDHLARRSRVKTLSVQDGAPNPPEVYSLAQLEKQVSGVVTSSASGVRYTVYAEVNKKTYKTVSDKDGYFCITFEGEQLQTGKRISLYATDVKDGETRKSAKTVVTVMDIMLYDDGYSRITIDALDNKSTAVRGTYLPGQNVFISLPEGKGNRVETVTVKEDGSFLLPLTGRLKAGETVYVYARYKHGGFADISCKTVDQSLPDGVYLTKAVEAGDTKIRVVAEADCEVVLKLAGETYYETDCEYDATEDGYVYTFEVREAQSGKSLKVYARNAAGNGPAFSTKVQ